MDISTFYALFSATCFTLLGLWWNVLQLNPDWIGVDNERKAVGGVYLTFLLPALMGLFAQVGGAETPTIWRVSFVAVAVVGCFSTLKLLRLLRTSSDKQPRAKYFATLGIYLLVAVIGALSRDRRTPRHQGHPGRGRAADPAGAGRPRAGLGLHGAPSPGRRARARHRGVTPARLAVLAQVAEALPDLDRPLLVAVDGADGAGKTRFADDLRAVLGGSGRTVVRASVDDFHHPRAHRHDLGRTGETVWTRSFDYRALRHHLLDPWCGGAGTPYRRRHHDLASDTLLDEPASEVPDHGVLVLDGVFAQREELRDCWDLVVWLEVPDAERVRRMAARDGVPPDPAHDDQRRYLDAQRSTGTPPTRSLGRPGGRQRRPARPVVVGVAVAPPGWHRTPHGLRRVVTTDADTAARINRLLGE